MNSRGKLDRIENRLRRRAWEGDAFVGLFIGESSFSHDKRQHSEEPCWSGTSMTPFGHWQYPRPRARHP
eukprot:2757672-Prymnesium_polylepis.1